MRILKKIMLVVTNLNSLRKLVFEFAVANLSLLVALYTAGVDGAILLPTICADYRTNNMLDNSTNGLKL